MVKGKFEVGDSEKHIVYVNANPFLKTIRIEVDGERVIDVANFQPVRKLQLDIGKMEKHHLDVHLRAFTPVKLFVDGKEIQQTHVDRSD